MGLAGAVPGMGALDDAVSDALAFQQANANYYAGNPSDPAAATQAGLDFLYLSSAPYDYRLAVAPDFAIKTSTDYLDLAGQNRSNFSTQEPVAMPPAFPWGSGVPSAAPVGALSTARVAGSYVDAATGAHVTIYEDGKWQSSLSPSLRYASSVDDAYAQSKAFHLSQAVPGSIGLPTPMTTAAGWQAHHQDANGVWVNAAGFASDGRPAALVPTGAVAQTTQTNQTTATRQPMATSTPGTASSGFDARDLAPALAALASGVQSVAVPLAQADAKRQAQKEAEKNVERQKFAQIQAQVEAQRRAALQIPGQPVPSGSIGSFVSEHPVLTGFLGVGVAAATIATVKVLTARSAG